MTARQSAAKVSVENTQPYHLRYRPRNLDEVLGQREVVDSLRGALNARARQHTYFLLGPAGCGKTTIARILAEEFLCDLIEVDAASTSGVDDTRKLTETMMYAAFGINRGRAFLIDECQRLSPQAWDSLLKSTEEPPDHVFFFFCSTDPRKIPATILTRGPSFNLRAIDYDTVMDALEAVCRAERLDTPSWALQSCARACGGSLRLAYVMLAQVQDCQTEEEAIMLLEGMGVEPEVIDLCRALASRKLDWIGAVKLVKSLKDKGTVNAEGLRIQLTAYMTAALLGDSRNPGHLLNVLVAFSKPCNTTDGMAPVLLALADILQN